MNVNENNKLKFYLSSAKKRLWVKFFEYIFLVGINLLICYLFTFSLLNWSTSKLLVQGWIFSLCLFFNFITCTLVWFGYFILLPYFFNGYTLISKIAKLKLYTNDKNWTLVNFIKRELFSWLPINIVCIVMSLVSFAFSDPVNFLTQIVAVKSIDVSTAERTVGYIFTFLFIISTLPLIFVIINTLANSHARNVVDCYSSIVVVDLASRVNYKKVTIENDSDLPIILDEGELDKL